MKDLVEYIVKQFVSNPDAVEVTEENQDGYINIALKVAPEDMGLTIGKSGQTIKAIRRLLTIKAINEQARVNLELIDSGTPRETSQDDQTGSDDRKSDTPASGESENSDQQSPSESEPKSEEEKSED